MEIKDKRVLVTGASSGIGQAIAINLAEKGAHVIINYRNNKEGALETLAQVEKHSTGEIVQADLTDKTQVVSMFDSIGDIDVLVNNAGDSQSGDIFNDEVWDYQHNSILMTAVFCTQAFLKQSKKHKKIVNISSVYGNSDTGRPRSIAYSVYKAALNSLTKNLAKDADENLQVNAVAPGYTWTPAWDGVSADRKEKCLGLTNINRWVDTKEIAQTVLMLLENDAINGQIITVDGGLSLLKLP